MADTDGTFIVTMLNNALGFEPTRMRYQPKSAAEAIEYGQTMMCGGLRWTDFTVHQVVEVRIY